MGVVVFLVTCCCWKHYWIRFFWFWLFPSLSPSGDVHQVDLRRPARDHRNNWRGKNHFQHIRTLNYSRAVCVKEKALTQNITDLWQSITFRWDDSTRLSLCIRVQFAGPLARTGVQTVDKLRSIHSLLFFFLSLPLCLCSLQLTAVRRSMQEMKSFKSITRLWWVSYSVCVCVCSYMC